MQYGIGTQNTMLGDGEPKDSLKQLKEIFLTEMIYI